MLSSSYQPPAHKVGFFHIDLGFITLSFDLLENDGMPLDPHILKSIEFVFQIVGQNHSIGTRGTTTSDSSRGSNRKDCRLTKGLLVQRAIGPGRPHVGFDALLFVANVADGLPLPTNE